MFCFVFNILFGLLYLGPVVAFSAYVASCTIFLNVSYAIPILVLLIRGRKVLDNYQTAKTPFKLGKTFGLFVNIVGAIYVVVTSVVSLLYFRQGFDELADIVYSSSVFPRHFLLLGIT